MKKPSLPLSKQLPLFEELEGGELGFGDEPVDLPIGLDDDEEVDSEDYYDEEEDETETEDTE